MANKGGEQLVEALFLFVLLKAPTLSLAPVIRQSITEVEPRKMHAEFTSRRVAEQVYTAWFRKRLIHQTAPVDLPAAADVEVLDAFDPSPFSISPGEGRLCLPEKVLAIWEKREATSAMVQAFQAKHFDEFMGKSTVCFATVREFLMGKRNAEDGAKELAKPPVDANDPSTPYAVAALPMRVECVSSTGKSKLLFHQLGPGLPDRPDTARRVARTADLFVWRRQIQDT